MSFYRALNLLRGFAWKYPKLYRPIGRLRQKGDVFDLDYDLTVEGYPRSANTFVANVLKTTQPKLRVRSHRHIPPHVIAAVQSELPVLFLIRPPLDCVASCAIMLKTSALPQLVYYVAYHTVLRPYLDQIFVADFSLVTSDCKAVLQGFARWSHTPVDLSFDIENVRQGVFTMIDRDNTDEYGTLNERSVNRPTRGRAVWKSKLVAEMESPVNRRWLDKANALYLAYRAKAISVPLV